MFEEEIKRKLSDFREVGIPNYIPRKSSVNLVEYMASTIIGSRRAGKSFRALQLADELIKNGTIESINHVCSLNFDNPILSNMQAKDLKLIPESMIGITSNITLNTPLLFTFDEIHKIPGWEQFIVDLSQNKPWKVIVTGSSSKLLKTDIATELRGKAISTTQYPLSFPEFLSFKKVVRKNMSTTNRSIIKANFDEYLKWGAYPAIANLQEHLKEILLREYFDTMILKDIIQRYNISKPKQCIKLYNYLLSIIGRPFTIENAYNFLKESDFTTSKDSIKNYIAQAEDSWLLFTVPIYSNSQKEQERNYRKLYSIDWALAALNSLTWDGSYSRMFENMVYIHLRKKFSRVNYYLTRSNRQEIDFLCTNNQGKLVLAVQASMNITANETLSRELKPLISAAKYFGIKENLIITVNQEKTFEQEGIIVKAVPAWKWLMEED